MRRLTGLVLLLLLLLPMGMAEATKPSIPIEVTLRLAATERTPGGEIPLTFTFGQVGTGSDIQVRVRAEGAVEALPLKQDRWTRPVANQEYAVPVAVRVTGFGYGQVSVTAGSWAPDGQGYGKSASVYFLVAPEGIFVSDGTATSLERLYFDLLVAEGKLRAGKNLYERITQTANGGGGQPKPALPAGTTQEIGSYARPFYGYEMTATGSGDVDLVVLGPDGQELGASRQPGSGVTERVTFDSTWFGRYTMQVKTVTDSTYLFTIDARPVVLAGDTSSLRVRTASDVYARVWLGRWPYLVGGLALVWLVRRRLQRTA